MKNLLGDNGDESLSDILKRKEEEIGNKRMVVMASSNNISILEKTTKETFLELTRMDGMLKQLYQTYKEMRDRKLKHLQSLISAAEDVREEGIVWMVKAIWCMGEDVDSSTFPSCLDKQARQ